MASGWNLWWLECIGVVNGVVVLGGINHSVG